MPVLTPGQQNPFADSLLAGAERGWNLSVSPGDSLGGNQWIQEVCNSSEALRSGAEEANALHGERRRLSVRAVKAAFCAFIGAKRQAFYEKGRPGQAPFSRLFARKSDAMTLLS